MCIFDIELEWEEGVGWVKRKKKTCLLYWGCPHSLLLVLYITPTNVLLVKSVHIKSMT